MSFPSPTPRQAAIIWGALTALAVAVVVGLLVVMLVVAGWVVQRLSPVLWPLAVAAILAYLLDPLVDWLERRRVPRPAGILLVFLLALVILALALYTVIPVLLIELGELRWTYPEHLERIWERWRGWVVASPLAEHAQLVRLEEWRESIQAWLMKVAPVVSGFLLVQLTRLASWAGVVIGLGLVPIYTFYFLLEKQGISRQWTHYLPVRESAWKEETIFILRAINDYLILFFRGQVLVAMCVGFLLTAGFWAVGLNYAFLLGAFAGVMSIVPFLGVVLSLVPALLLAAVQFGDWLHPLLVLGVFVAVQTVESLFISPKIMGERVGLHPLTIIVAVMVGTTLMGGIIGGILAIPLTASLRVLMFRYVWKQPPGPQPARRRRAVEPVEAGGQG
jgi:predicted PurR-regulated permease PerM